jgi:serralysin
VFRSSTLHAATIQEPYANIFTQGNVYIQNSQYIIFDGFAIAGYPHIPNAGADGIVAEYSQHIWFINNIVHDVGGAGIGSIHSDYVNVEGNIVYSNACCGQGGTSGIDYWAPLNADNNPGFHNIISNNISFNNSEGADGRNPHTEGHGIILDNFRLDGYTGATLIENNLIYGNGGQGIALYYSNNVTIRNNTAFDNVRDPLLGYTGGDIFVVNSSHVTGVNNIAVTNITTNSKIRSIWDQTWDGTNIGNVWANNLTFDGNPGDPSVTQASPPYGTPITAANGNILGSDPLFDNVPQGQFTLQDTSPAIGEGTAAHGVPALDLAGNVRSTSVIDIGAFAVNVVPPS